jgi:CDP-paratose 2-epimerase
MPLAIVTGSGGLIGSASVEHFVRQGFDVIGIENDMRSRFFGPEASTSRTTERLQTELAGSFRSVDMDIRDADGMRKLVADNASDLALVIHTAAQPSHDWAASDAIADFTVNANGTLNMLEAVRHEKPDATFIHMSTNKVYGDRPNFLPLIETETRLELPEDHQFYGGIDTSMSIDRTMHSVFGASKVAADVMVQEYGRYFEMPTVCFRGGCLTGPAHAGAKLHGFLSYLMKCTVTGTPYTIFGYEGKQVRDNIHAADVVKAFDLFHQAPTTSAVYNLGGGRRSNVSMLEAIQLCQEISGLELDWTVSDQNRTGDHRWYISDFSSFERDYPSFKPEFGIHDVLTDILAANAETWSAAK